MINSARHMVHSKSFRIDLSWGLRRIWPLPMGSISKKYRPLSTTASLSEANHHDVLIVGGGVVGCATAHLLERKCPGISIGLMERKAPSHAESSIPHPRSYALSPKSLELLGRTITDGLKLGAYQQMQVWEELSPAMLMFTSDDLLHQTSNSDLLGACVEDGPLVSTLWGSLETTKKYTGDDLESLSQADRFVNVSTSSGKQISAWMVVGADGGRSWVRQESRIGWTGWSYDRSALTFTVELERPMQPRRAYQRFLRHGPLALLPTHSPEHAVVVWSTTPDEASRWKNDGDDNQVVDQVNTILQQGPQALPKLFEGDTEKNTPITNLLYGMERVVDSLQYGLGMKHFNDFDSVFLAPPKVQQVVSTKFTFPLSCYTASNFARGRVALVGDAAHVVHPLAGQGLNLGLKDVDALVKTIQKSFESGMDVATFLMTDYETNRQLEVNGTVQGIHVLHEVFGRKEAAAVHAKSLGMQFMQHVGPVRRQLASIAAGQFP